jgi:hypothetical protein
VRSSRSITPLYKHCNLQCSNVECGHTFACAFEFLHTIAPSAQPNLNLHLPTAPPRQRRAVANDNPSGSEVPPLAANDDDRLDEAVAI